jgi:hypothetical protein
MSGYSINFPIEITPDDVDLSGCPTLDLENCKTMDEVRTQDALVCAMGTKRFIRKITTAEIMSSPIVVVAQYVAVFEIEPGVRLKFSVVPIDETPQ